MTLQFASEHLRPFEFATAQQIVFGSGKVSEIPRLAGSFGKRALLLTGRTSHLPLSISQAMQSTGLTLFHHTIDHEPDIQRIETLAESARADGIEWIVACGGGSVIDAGKAIAALCTNLGPLEEYLEVVGKGQPLSHPSIPLIAVPTTAGTGAEVTRNAVLAVPSKNGRPGLKVSLRSPTLLPAVALIDPSLTASMPPAITAATGMDALTQCLEPMLSNRANPLTDAIAATGLTHAARCLPTAFHDGTNAPARESMAFASLCGGLALANAKLGAVHGFAGVIGGSFPAPHGAVCARLLPSVFAANVEAVFSRGESAIQGRFYEVARILTGDKTSSPQAAVEWLHQLIQELQIPGLATYGIGTQDFDTIIEAAAGSSSMQGNPIALSHAEMRAILQATL